MKDKAIDAAYVASVGLFSTLGIHTLNDGLTAIAGVLAVVVGIIRSMIAIRDWRNK